DALHAGVLMHPPSGVLRHSPITLGLPFGQIIASAKLVEQRLPNDAVPGRCQSLRWVDRPESRLGMRLDRKADVRAEIVAQRRVCWGNAGTARRKEIAQRQAS